jgi:D-alanyl-D-alanine carboxypeptidase
MIRNARRVTDAWRRRRRLAGVVLLGLVVAACGAGSDGAPRAESSARQTPAVRAVDAALALELVDDWRADVHAFGVGAAIRVPGHRDVFVASGVDDRHPETPMPTTGVFSIASITKTFVASIVLRLVDEGRLALDDTIERWFPDVPSASRITIAMLLSHTSGIADFGNDRPGEMRDLLVSDLGRRFTPEEAFAYSTRLGPSAEPGARFSYSNANYQALGIVASRVTGVALGDLIADRFAGPLGLGHTTLDDGSLVAADAQHGWFTLDYPGDPEADVANGTFDPTVPRDLDVLDFPHAALQTFAGGAGAMTSSLDDLLAWGQALYSGQVLGARLTDRMLRFDNHFGPGLYGLGAEGFCPCDESADPPTATLVGHDGSGIGSRTILGFAPDSGVTVAVHANVEEISSGALSRIAVALAGLAER